MSNEAQWAVDRAMELAQQQYGRAVNIPVQQHVDVVMQIAARFFHFATTDTDNGTPIEPQRWRQDEEAGA